MTVEAARRLRREQTDVERKLWTALRNRRFGARKFRRRRPIRPYVADFVCLEARLVVELDGSQHGLPENVSADARRTAYLDHLAYRVLRFRNHDVNAHFESVLEGIDRALESGPPSATVK